MKKVSVIIPVYNVQEYLKECLESIINQTYKKIEIIIINDGSTDDSGSICKLYQQKNKNIIYIDSKNEGVSIARNKGIASATGDYLVFVDADDVVSKNYIEMLVMLIKKSQMGIIGYTNDKLNLSIKVDHNIRLEKKDNVLYQILSGNKYEGYLWNKIFDYRIIKKEKIKFQEKSSVWEDLLFVAEYMQRINTCAIIDSSYYFYRSRANSAVNKIDLKKTEDKLNIAKKLLQIEFMNSECMEVVRLRYFGILYEYAIRKGKLGLLSKEEKRNILNELNENRYIEKLSWKEKIKFIIWKL